MRYPLLLLACLLPLAACIGDLFRPEPFWLGGIQVNEADHERWVAGLEAAGMNTVSVTVYAHQGDWDSENLWFDETDEAVIREIRTAKARGLEVVLILRVALDHAFAANRFLWHGMIQPRTEAQVEEWFRRYRQFVGGWAERAEAEGVDLLGVASEMNELASTLPVVAVPALHDYYLDVAKQEAYQEEMLRHQEAIASQHLELPFSGGFDALEPYLLTRTETYRRWAAQTSFEGYEDRLGRINERRRLLDSKWRELIAGVRERYSGKLTYAANFDQYHEVGFWPTLDVMGINAYFPLRTAAGPEEGPALQSLLREGWRSVLADVVAFQGEHELAAMPVVFTELGYTRRKGATVEPWAGSGFSLVPVAASAPDAPAERELVVWPEAPLDPRERAIAVSALGEAAGQVAPGLLRGVLYWKLSTIPDHAAIEPFVLILGPANPDPLLPALQALPSLARGD